MKETINKLEDVLCTLREIKAYGLKEANWKGFEETASVLNDIISEFIDNVEEQIM